MAIWKRRLYKLAAGIAVTAGAVALGCWTAPLAANLFFNELGKALFGPGSVSLSSAMSEFGLTLPPDAHHVVFDDDASGQGWTLTLRFTTTPSALRTFLAEAHLPPPSANTQPVVVFDDGYDDGALYPSSSVSNILYSNGGQQGVVTVAVDPSDPAAPVVWVNAAS